MTRLSVGCLVENPLKAEWGPGKVARLRRDTLFVFFRDLPGERARKFKADALRLANEQSDPVLDNLPPFIERDGDLVIPAGRITPAEARKRFLRHYPGGFADPGYIGTESALGFDIRYDPRPNWVTYDRVLQMSRLYMGQLEDLGPRDFIDIQSFFWVTGGSFEKTLAAQRAKRSAPHRAPRSRRVDS